MIYEGLNIEMLSTVLQTPVNCLAMDFYGASQEARQQMQGGFPITREILGELRTHYYILFEKNCISSPSLIKAYWNADYLVVYFKLAHENFIRTGINPFVLLSDVKYLGVHTHNTWLTTRTNNPHIYDGIYTYAPWAWKNLCANLNVNSPILGSLIQEYGSIHEAMSQSKSSSSSLSETNFLEGSPKSNPSILEKQSESSQESSPDSQIESVSLSDSDSVNSSSNSGSNSDSNSDLPGQNLVESPDLVMVKKVYGENIEQNWKILEGCDWEKAEKQDMLKRKLTKYMEAWDKVDIRKANSQESLDIMDETYPNKRRKT